MLIYLYAITLGGEERYGKVTPAGILYMPATVKPVSYTHLAQKSARM